MGDEGGKNEWVQVCGHQDSFLRNSSRSLVKLLMPNSNEALFYRSIFYDPMSQVTPRFYREFKRENQRFIEIEDLLHNFEGPNVLDIKMGTRTFSELETEKFDERPDLYEKMVKIDPNEPTAEEKLKKSITKLRYMKFRDEISSTTTLGLRLEAMSLGCRKAKPIPKNCKTEKELFQVTEILIDVFTEGKKKVCERLLKRLEEIQQCLLSSTAFRTNEIVGSSLLFICDQNEKANIWMIDFAKTHARGSVKHNIPWVNGNHEDGYLIGLNNLINIFKKYLMKSVHDVNS